MRFPAWAITGFKLETFVSASSVEKCAPDETTGRLQELTQTIMHGASLTKVGKRRGYAYLKACLQSMADYENTPLCERGIGAVSGGVTMYPVGNDSIEDPAFVISQKWGAITAPKAEFLGGFLSSDESKLFHVMVCFHQTDVAHVSGIWRNGRITFGPNILRDRASWAKGFRSTSGIGNYSIALETVKSMIVVDAEFAETDDSKYTVQPELVSSQSFLNNNSSVDMTDTFDVQVSTVNTHTFEFEEGLGIDCSSEWEVKVPVVSETDTETMKVGVSFPAHQRSTTSKPRTIERSVAIAIPPMTGCLATARYSKRVLTLDAILTVQKVYTNGSVHLRRVPAKYIGVSCFNVEIRLQDIPVEPLP